MAPICSGWPDCARKGDGARPADQREPELPANAPSLRACSSRELREDRLLPGLIIQAEFRRRPNPKFSLQDDPNRQAPAFGNLMCILSLRLLIRTSVLVPYYCYIVNSIMPDLTGTGLPLARVLTPRNRSWSGRGQKPRDRKLPWRPPREVMSNPFVEIDAPTRSRESSGFGL